MLLGQHALRICGRDLRRQVLRVHPPFTLPEQTLHVLALTVIAELRDGLLNILIGAIPRVAYLSRRC